MHHVMRGNNWWLIKIESDQALTLCHLQHLFVCSEVNMIFPSHPQERISHVSEVPSDCPHPLWITLITAFCASLLPVRMNAQTHFVTCRWLGYMTTFTRYSQGKAWQKRRKNANNTSTFPALLHLFISGNQAPSVICPSALICINNEEPCLQSILFCLHVSSGGLTDRWIIKQGPGRHQQTF